MIQGKHVPVHYQRGMAPAHGHSPGFEFWTKRPGNRWGGLGGPFGKLFTHRQERRAIPREIRAQLEEAPIHSRPSRRSPFNFYERWWAGKLEKGGYEPDYARRVAAGEGWGGGVEEARYQVWLYDHRPEA